MKNSHKCASRMVVLLGLVVTVVACSSGNGSIGAAEAPITSSAQSSQATVDELKVIAYAPEKIKAGQAFQVQPDGGSALSMKLNHSVAGSPVAIWWDDQRLVAAVNGDVISVMVPATLYATAGTHSLQARLGKDGQGQKSNIVKVTVE